MYMGNVYSIDDTIQYQVIRIPLLLKFLFNKQL